MAVCTYCGAVLKTKWGLRKHTLAQENRAPYKCCEKTTVLSRKILACTSIYNDLLPKNCECENAQGARNSKSIASIERVVDGIRENDEKLLDEILFDEKVDLNDIQDGVYPLHMCVGHVECVKVLLGYGAKPDLVNQDGKQAIHLAVERDFVETLMHLVIQGADIDVTVAGPDSNTTGKTPLQIAIEEEALTCQDFLHLLGAKIPDDKLSILDDDSKMKYKVIQQGFADRKLACGGSEIPANCRRPVQILDRKGEQVGIDIQGCNDSFIVHVRRMQVEYQSSCTRIPTVSIPDGMELVSDIYQYRVDKNVKCDIQVPLSLGDRSNRYYELVLVQTFGQTRTEEHRDINLNNTNAFVKGMTMYAYGSSPIVSFGIFTRTKTDRKVIDRDHDMNMTSSVEPKFEVKAPASTTSSLAGKEIQMQVTPAVDSEKSSDSAFGRHSDFHTVATVSTQTSDEQTGSVTPRPLSAASRCSYTTENLYIKLPKPKEETGSEALVLACPQGEDGTESSSWERHESFKTTETVVECTNAKFASYIVLIEKIVKNIGLLKEKVSELFSRSKGGKKMCKLFAMVKNNETISCYLVYVVLCEVTEYKELLQNYLNQNFKEQECGPTDDTEIDTKCTYILKLRMLKGAAVLGVDNLPIQYQGNNHKFQMFQVETETKSACGELLSFKKQIPKKETEYGKKCKAKLAIWIGELKKESIQPDKFLSDKFIDSVAREKIGEKWFSLGIHLGFSCEELISLQNTEPFMRNSLVLYKWRDDRSRNWDEKLDNFILATRQAELPGLKQAICKNVIDFQKKNSELDRWVQKYAEAGRDRQEIKLKLDTLRTPAVSPLDDKFLLFIAKKLSYADEMVFVELDLSIDELQERIGNQTQRKCKLLMLARDKCSSPIGFLKKLKRKLSKLQLNFQVEEISECTRKWLESDESSKEDIRTREEIRAIFK